MEEAFVYDDVRLTPKQQISIHTQNEWELSYVIRGQGIRFLGEEKQPFYEGEIILIPPKFPHGWFFDMSLLMRMVIYITSRFCLQLSCLQDFPWFCRN